jgi:hypothetical protein
MDDALLLRQLGGEEDLNDLQRLMSGPHVSVTAIHACMESGKGSLIMEEGILTLLE